MKVINRLFKILSQRYKVWILMLFILILVLETALISNDVNEWIPRQIFTASTSIDTRFDKDGNLLPQTDPFGDYGMYSDPYEEGFKKFAEDHKDGFSEDYFTSYVEIYEKAKKNYGLSDEDILGYDDNVSEEEWEFRSNFFEFADFKDKNLTKTDDGNYKLNISVQITKAPTLYAFIFIIAFLLTSSEHLTKYNEFTQMFPWAKEKTFLSKVIFGFIVTVLSLLLIMIFKFAALKTSNLSNIIAMGDFTFYLLNHLLRLIGFYFLVMGTGALAGNFIGHIGSLLIALMGLDLLILNAKSLLALFLGQERINTIFLSIDQTIEKLPEIIASFLMPGSAYLGTYSYVTENSLGIFAAAVFILILGIYWSRKAKPERSQMLILKRPENNIIKFLAIITTSNLITYIVVSAGSGRIIGLVVFFVALVLTYKFYNFLFKTKIGFN